MPTTPKISIIIPIYKVEKFLRQTLESVKNQTFRDFEALCVNDGSPDGSLNIIKEFAAADDRFVLIDQPNQGVAMARNAGLKAARGQYVMFLDGDDYMHPQCMEIALAAIEQTDADVCRFDYHEVDAAEKVDFTPITDHLHSIVADNPIEKYIEKRVVPDIVVWNKIYKADLAKSVAFLPLSPGEDDVYTLEILLRLNKFIRLELPLIYYVQNPQSVMHKISEEQKTANCLKINNLFIPILLQYAVQHPQTRLADAINYRIGCLEREVCKNLLIKPLRFGIDNATLRENYRQYRQRIKEDKQRLLMLKFKQRVMLWLLERQHYTAARWLVRF